MKLFNRLFCTISALLLSLTVLCAQDITVKGVIKDSKGEPIIGANIFLSGSTIGASTDLDGKYEITAPANGTIIVSSVGFKSEEIKVDGRTEINLTLTDSASELESVMVVAYGTAKKESFTGSAAVVKGDNLKKRLVGNVTKSFEGTVAGVQVSSGGGQPGEGASVIVRGIGSINAVATPLYVVDGIPYDGSLSSINPADIESLTVLKDASAGALYGARGANGVIVITTKRGDKDRVNVSYKGNVGVASRALARYDLVGMDEYVELTYEALRNSGQYGTGMDFQGASAYAAANLGKTIGGLKNPEYYNPYKNYSWETLINRETGKINSDASAAWDENWMDEISDNSALRTEHVLSVSGGSQKNNYLVSFGYYNEKGVLQNTDFDRYTGRVNADSQAKDWLKIGMNTNFAHSDSDYQDFSGTSVSNVWYTAQFIAPVYPVYQKDMNGNNVLDENGNLQYEYGSEDDNGFANRPTAQGFNSKAELFNNKSYFSRNSFSARPYLTLGTINKEALLYGLKLSVNLGTDFNDYQRTIVYDKYHGNAAAQGGRISKTNSRTLSYTFNQIVNYDKDFGEHSIKLLFGHEYYRYKYNYQSGVKTGIVDGIDELGPAVTSTDNGSYSNNYGIESYFSRINYGFKDRYYFDASWRTDGSSRFYKDNRWGSFWSVGASWRLSQESFMQQFSSWLSNLTVKASYGVQGNDNLGTYYAWQGLYDYTWPNATDAGAFVSTLENKAITWEKNGNLNTGIEASLFGGRLGFTAEYYNRKTDDMLLENPMAISTGFTGYSANIGSLRNQGVEINVRGTIIDKPNFRWDATLIGSLNRNKVLALTGSQNTISSGARVIEVGKPIYTFYLPKSAGVDPATGKQLYYAYYEKGVNEDGTISNVKCDEYVTDNVSLATLSKYYNGSREPKFQGSFGSNFVIYKNIDFSFLTTFSVGGYVYDGLYNSAMFVQFAGNNWHSNALRRWQQPGDVTDIPMIEIGGTYATTDNSLINASYFAIKNVTLGYTLPRKWLNKLDVASLRIFASLDNFAMFDHLDGMDPQYSFTGSVSYTYAPVRVAAIGLDLNF